MHNLVIFSLLNSVKPFSTLLKYCLLTTILSAISCWVKPSCFLISLIFSFSFITSFVNLLVDGSTCSKYEIFVQSLNYDTKNLIDFEKNKNEIEKNRESNLRKNTIIPPHAKQIALARYDLVNLWIDYKKQSKNKTQAVKDFLHEYNEGKMYPIIFNIVGQV